MKRPLFLALLIVFSLLASACGSLTPESLALVAEPFETTTIRIATSRIEGLEAAIAAWEREHPTIDVDVVLNSPDDHHEALLRGDRRTGSVDIIGFEGEYTGAIRTIADSFVDLREFELDELQSNFLPPLWDQGIGLDGELIGLPIDADAKVLFVRNDLARASTLNDLASARTWCDVLEYGGDFADSSGKAFFADGEELLRAILSQSRSSWVTSTGQQDPDAVAELERAWDLSMLAIGEQPVFGNPCPELLGQGSIARDLTPGESIWRSEIASDDFGAVISQWSTRERISQAHPQSSRSWTAIALPRDAQVPGAGNSSEGGLHFAIAADSEHTDIALDLILTLSDPVIQESTFNNGHGPLPSARALYDDDTVAEAEDDFFVGEPSAAATFADAVRLRARGRAMPERQVVISALSRALAQVQSGVQTPEIAWDEAFIEVVAELSQR